jgi:hypothetical protein
VAAADEELRDAGPASTCSVPTLLKIAKTLSSWTSSRVFRTVSAVLYASSTYRYLIWRPRTPPRELTYLK